MISLVDLPRTGSPVGRRRAADAVHQGDFHPDILEWVDHNDARNTTLSLIREARTRGDFALAVFNFTPILRRNYRLGVPRAGQWQ